MKRLCQVGDVIRSDRFYVWEPGADGYYSLCDVDEKGHLNSYRGNDFLVVSTEMTGGGSGHGSGDSYPDGHLVYVKMFHGFDTTTGQPILDKSGLSFYQTGCFRGMIEPKEINLIKTLKREVKETWSV